MYAREGFVPISRLWRDFEGKYLSLCKTRALARMEADRHSSDFVFGTALDLCEDVFLRTFDSTRLSLIPLKGEIIEVEPVLPHSGARLLTKLSAFESTHVSMFPDEAGLDGKWLRQMGSSAFKVAELGWLWPDKAGRETGADLENLLFADVFNTLPILFERPAFVIAHERPPWSFDLLEESYARTLWGETRGSSICLSDASVRRWKKSLSVKGVDMILLNLLFDMSLDQDSENRSIIGRPAKLDVVKSAYQTLGFIEKNLSRKEERRLIENFLEDEISESTLDRVRRTLRSADKEIDNDQS
jgi:hypothetical protein